MNQTKPIYNEHDINQYLLHLLLAVSQASTYALTIVDNKRHLFLSCVDSISIYIYITTVIAA